MAHGREKCKRMEELHQLDLSHCRTLGEIVEGMRQCAFGAQMLGEVAATLCKWVEEGKEPIVVYDGKTNTPLGRLLRLMRDSRGFFSKIMWSEEYARQAQRLFVTDHVLVIGPFSERFENALSKRSHRAIFINQYGMAPRGQIRDGYFPDVVFADPRFVMPIISAVMSERLEVQRAPISVVSMLEQHLHPYGGLAAEVAHGAKTLRATINDKKCETFLTISGAMTIAKMGLVICDLIDTGAVQYVSATGALMAHGLIESVGLKHYKYNPAHGDPYLARHGLNRVTSVLEPETNFDHIEKVLGEVLDGCVADGEMRISPSAFHRRIGAHLAKHYPQQRGILKSAYEKNVPVFVPAFYDSEIGNDVITYNEGRRRVGSLPIEIDMERDACELVRIATHAKKIGIFSIGGGVPRNNVQNVAPLIDLMNKRLKVHLPERKFSYGCRIAPDAMHFGHLSGCTYREGMSWGKMDPRGMFGEIHADATIILPFLVKYLLETA